MSSMIISFRAAIHGILLVLKERNFRIHLLLLALVISAGIYFKIAGHEWLVLFFISALVLSLEMINSAIERTCDLYSKEKNEAIRKIKDIAAGAVLLAALFSVVIGILIFGKHIFPQ